jgi:uncharacterized protein involved in tolerance to divalent cations
LIDDIDEFKLTTYNSVYITAASRDEALTIGRALVEVRLAACARTCSLA